MKKASKVLIVLAAVGLIGFGTYAFAHMGGGYGPSGWGNQGPGWHHRGWGGQGYGYMMGDLNDNEIKKMDEERRAFLKETESLRQDLYEKDLALRSELAKKNPDAVKAASLQKEISDLGSQLDQKRIDHMIKMRSISPNVGRGFMGGGPMMGYGPGFGSCWR